MKAAVKSTAGSVEEAVTLQKIQGRKNEPALFYRINTHENKEKCGDYRGRWLCS